MATPEDEIKDLREKNNELVQKVQYWKMTAAQRENEKLALMKEINELRLKLSRTRSSGNVKARKLDAELQDASEKALAHLVRASGEIAKTIEITKEYMRDRQEAELASVRWSTISGTPTPVKTEKVHRVPPLLMGGQSIQPVVALSRTLLNTSNPRSAARSPNQSSNITERAVPMHMLQDVYIPLTRIDANMPTNNMDADTDSNHSDSSDELVLNENAEPNEESLRMSEDESYETSRRLDAVVEDLEPEDGETPPRLRPDNPLEGPSWLLDRSERKSVKSRTTLEPDSTTELEESSLNTSAVADVTQPTPARRPSREFSPTVRRRKRTSSPAPHRHSGNVSGRILKVMVAKMSLEGSPSPSPAKRCVSRAPLDAPSPNGATVSGVIVSETSNLNIAEDIGSGEPAPGHHQSLIYERDDERSSGVPVTPPARRRPGGAESPGRAAGSAGRGAESPGRGDRGRGGRESTTSTDSGGSDRTSGGRTRRNRNIVTYKEKPLNRKMRR